MIYLFISILLLGLLAYIWLGYQKHGDKKSLFLALAILAMLLFLSYVSKVLWVYKPLLLLHISLLLVAWYHYARLLKGKQPKYFWFFLPWLSLVLFIMISLFAKEHG